MPRECLAIQSQPRMTMQYFILFGRIPRRPSMVGNRPAASAAGHHDLGSFRFLTKPTLIVWSKPALVSFMPLQQLRTYLFLVPKFPMHLQRHLRQNRASIFHPTEPIMSGGPNTNNDHLSHQTMLYPSSQLYKDTPSCPDFGRSTPMQFSVI
jgi:hypothetical protein